MTGGPLISHEVGQRLLDAAEWFGDEAAADFLNQPFRFATESPIEKALACAFLDVAPYQVIPEVYEDQRDLFVGMDPSRMFRLETQVCVSPYRLDLLLSNDDGVRLAIECDGRAYHSSPEQVARDRRRDERLVAEGYRVLRFPGSRIHHDAPGVAREALSMATALAGWW